MSPTLLLREARAASALDHSHIATIYQIGADTFHTIPRTSFRGRLLIQRPPVLRRRAINQAIGRAAAHEPGHVLLQAAQSQADHRKPRRLGTAYDRGVTG